MKGLLALFFATSISVAAQPPQVPHKMQFAGITLTIRDDARKEIQKDVDALTQSPKHHNIKVERAKTYFPIIEKVFQEERVPDDFKYLVLQESALIPDAVSVSNAVGFWQFKDFTAAEMGLRMDRDIDERLNIVSSTRAAAQYLKKNNFYFNNWVYALQAYQMGAGGVMKAVKDSQSGAKHMEITSSTYWYVKKFLAHKVAFETAVKGEGQLKMLTYETQSAKSLKELANEIQLDEQELRQYNKWTKSGNIPGDKRYIVAIPVVGNPSVIKLPETVSASINDQDQAKPNSATSKHPNVTAIPKEERKKINGIVAIRAGAADTPAKLAEKAGVNLSTFLKWNDISISTRITEGDYYLLGKKRNRASEAYHKVSAGENLWAISQQYGVQQKALKRFNKIESDREVKEGMTLWLASARPKESTMSTASGPVVEVDNAKTFNWSLDGGQTQPVASTKQIVVATSTKDEPQQLPVDSTKTLQIDTTPIKQVVEIAPIKIETPIIEKKTEHVVQPGETLYGIAREYGLDVMELVRWNELNLQEGIKPKQVLKLVGSQPVAEQQPEVKNTPGNEHIVIGSDTLYSIARKYGVTIKELMDWNQKTDFSISVGERLLIKPK